MTTFFKVLLINDKKVLINCCQVKQGTVVISSLCSFVWLPFRCGTNEFSNNILMELLFNDMVLLKKKS